MQKGILSALLIGASLLLNLPAAAQGTLRLCYESADVRPWRTHDGKGLNFELLDQVARQSEMRFRYEAMAWPRCLAQLRANQIDGAIGASFKTDRLEIGRYPGNGQSADSRYRTHDDRYVVIRQKGSKADWDGKIFSQLGGHIGTQFGYSVIEPLQKLGVPLDTGAQSAEALIQKLLAGRLALAVMLEGEARQLIAAWPDARQNLEILPQVFIEKPYYLLLSHTLVREKPALAEQIWEQISAVRQSAAYQRAIQNALQQAPR